MTLHTLLRRRWLLAAVVVTMLLGAGSAAAETIYPEGTAANDSFLTAEIPTGFTGNLDAITGGLSPSDTADYFQIFIHDPSNFEAKLNSGQDTFHLTLYSLQQVTLAAGDSISNISNLSLGSHYLAVTFDTGVNQVVSSYRVDLKGDMAVIPLPGALLLLGAGLVRLAAHVRSSSK